MIKKVKVQAVAAKKSIKLPAKVVCKKGKNELNIVKKNKTLGKLVREAKYHLQDAKREVQNHPIMAYGIKKTPYLEIEKTHTERV